MQVRAIPNVTPLWVDSPHKLKELAKHLARQTSLGVDTESNSLFAYREKTCLIQISTMKKDYLIDPLVLSDLSLLKPVFANSNIQKIFHAAEYDLLCLKRDFHFEFVNIFDTMLACRLLGWKDLSLSAQLKNQFGLELDKHFQKANWGLRPLSEEQKRYAALDSHFLIELRDCMQSALNDACLLELAAEDFAHLAKITPPPFQEKDECANINGKGRLNPRQMAVLRSLCHFRELQAQNRDVPPFKIVGSEPLLELAKKIPDSVSDMNGIEGLSGSILIRYGEGMLAAVRAGKKAPPPLPYERSIPDSAFLHRVELLKQWRKAEAAASSVESDVILPRELMEEIARHNPHSLSELSLLMKDYPWRFQHSSESILAHLKGKEES
jgi:ribonuclease D